MLVSFGRSGGLDTVIDNVDVWPWYTGLNQRISRGRRDRDHGSSSVHQRHDTALEKPPQRRQRYRKLGEPLLVVDVMYQQHRRLLAEEGGEKRNAVRHVEHPVEPPGVQEQENRGVEVHRETASPAEHADSIDPLVTQRSVLPARVRTEHRDLVSFICPALGLLEQVHLRAPGLGVAGTAPIQCQDLHGWCHFFAYLSSCRYTAQ